MPIDSRTLMRNIYILLYINIQIFDNGIIYIYILNSIKMFHTQNYNTLPPTLFASYG